MLAHSGNPAPQDRCRAQRFLGSGVPQVVEEPGNRLVLLEHAGQAEQLLILTLDRGRRSGLTWHKFQPVRLDGCSGFGWGRPLDLFTGDRLLGSDWWLCRDRLGGRITNDEPRVNSAS